MSEKLREAAQQALEALEAGPDVDPIFAGETEAALRAALAQQPEPVQEPVQEPVAWMVEGSLYASKEVAQKMGGNAYTLQALYTAPPQQTEPAQEPIGWLNGDDEYADFMHRELARIHQQRGSSTPKFFTIPVYTKPFRSKPLTDEEMIGIIDAELEGGSLLDVARAIERAHGIGEKE